MDARGQDLAEDERPSNPSCGLRAALNVVSGKWKPLILWHLLEGHRRYGQLRRELPDATEKVLIDQLRQLEADGVVGRTVLSDEPPAVSYALTPSGKSLIPVLAMLSAWGADHVLHAPRSPVAAAYRPSPAS